ncbi:MAG: HAD family phosphatase [bacterium]|nr:HAD family phosphatase [bacterium]
MVHNVIFDFGNVLGTFDKHRSCARLAGYSKKLNTQEIYDLIVGGTLEQSVENGSINNETFAQKIIEAIDAPALTRENCIEMWGNIFTQNDEIIPLLKDIKSRGVAIAVLSNTSGVHWQYVRKLDVMQILEEWDIPFILSHEETVTKPDTKIYRTALEALGCRAEDAVFVDDIAENVEAARSVGMLGIDYNCTKQPIEYLRDSLNKVLA